ncbi:sugar transferase [Pseudotabrizicola algicola]|uniref:Sugar transferase n=1 Tax=Pseudotabrizicola algicola TaxID=2709381 RepID=A0A6B3RHZ0_9RHOB|nr:sugar transferase [Pseudotabrizicola algicola]NEX45644.1 sugar transferase [Pseudotabrizicola algicola]
MPALALPTSKAGTRGASTRHKRALDVGLILLALPVLVPLLVVLALAVKLSSPGPALFFQTRIGRDGRRFRMVKFRSMYTGAEAARAALLAQSDRQGLCFKQKDDPRITPLGRVLRRASLDELPQLWNVLRGEMSLVGPRPALPEEVALYPPQALQRLAGLPGLTGLWQVSGRANVGFDEMVEMDVQYLQTASLRGDLVLIFRTLGAVALAKGAY